VPVLALSRGFAPGATTDDILKEFHYEPKTDADRAAIDRFMARSAMVLGPVDKQTEARRAECSSGLQSRIDVRVQYSRMVLNQHTDKLRVQLSRSGCCRIF
jgi:hypothetical protein